MLLQRRLYRHTKAKLEYPENGPNHPSCGISHLLNVSGCWPATPLCLEKNMTRISRLFSISLIAFPLMLTAQAPIKPTETCTTVQDMDAGTRAGIEAAAQQFFGAAAAGNTA